MSWLGMNRERPPAPCQKGDVIELEEMGVDPRTGQPDPCPIPPGSRGEVRHVTHIYGEFQISVNWFVHRSLMLIWPVDRFRIIARPRARYFQEALDGND